MTNQEIRSRKMEKCAQCFFENPSDAKFCQNCGRPLGITCPHCETVNTTPANFCKNCGTQLAAATTSPSDFSQSPLPPKRKAIRAATGMQGERRLVTIMFADISGFTALAETMDPETVRDLMNACFEQLVPVVHKYEGTVDKFIGDEIMALFGAPAAHENDAERALQAALEMMDALARFNAERGTDLGAHFGINTGRVIAGGIGTQARQEYSVMGDAVNVAARLEDASERGEIFVGPDTYGLTASLFDFETLEPLCVKGKVQPVRAYRLLGEKRMRTRFEVAVERGLTPYAGRQHELSVLGDCFERVKNQHGQVVCIAGEAGIGKSRLLFEFRQSVAPEDVVWLEGQCISVGRHTPYLPLIEMVKQAFGVEERDDETRIIQRIEDKTSDWEEIPRTTVPYLKYLLNVDPGEPSLIAMDPRERRAGILDGLRALLQEESRTWPLVLVVEDLHWIDEQSQAALEALMDVIPSAAILLLLTYRPEYRHSPGERSYVHRLTLTDLRPEESMALALGMLSGASLPPELDRLITGKGEGNPFYIEEVTRSLLEVGVLRQEKSSYTLARPIEEIHVPNTIQEVILSRIDRLEEEARAALQLASVIGREFTLRLLERISDLKSRSDGILEQLQVLELIYQKAYFPELAYMFKHALTQDVAYATLLRERRKALHRLIGTAIEELYADRLVEQYEILAYHYTQGEVWDKAQEYHMKAGEKAAAAFANQDALSHYARTLEACEKSGAGALPTAVEAAHKRGMLNITIADAVGAIADFERMRAAAIKLGDRYQEGLALVYRGLADLYNHDLETAEHTLNAALAIAAEGFEELRFLANVVMGFLFMIFNRHADARPIFRQIDTTPPDMNDPVMQGYWCQVKMLGSNWEGRFDEALKQYARNRQMTEKHSIACIRLQWTEAMALVGNGEYEPALALLEETVATCERTGEILHRGRALNTIGWLYSEIENHQQAMEWNQRSFEFVRTANYSDPEVESNARLNLGDNLLAVDRLDEAEVHFQHVEHIARNPRPQDRWMLWRYSQHLFHSYGELWLLRGDSDKALAYADECLALAEQSNSRKNIVKGRRLRGQALLCQGKPDEAEQEILSALEMARQVGNPPQLWKTHVALGDLRQARGRADEAHQAYTAALAVIDGMAATLTDQSLRETFVNSVRVQAIRAKVHSKKTS